MPTRALVLLARAPSAKGKTRLTAGLEPACAQALREALFLDTLEAARGAGVPLVVAFTPDGAREEMARLAPDAMLIPQRGEDLGARMLHAMADAFAGGADRVALIGSDLPTLPPHHVREALAALEAGADVVYGPAEDGGFYLVAASRPLRMLFEDVRWGSDRVLSVVVDRARRAGYAVALAPAWFDVDTLEDLDRAGLRTRYAPFFGAT